MAALDIATGLVWFSVALSVYAAVGFKSRQVDLVLLAVHRQNDELRTVERHHSGNFAGDHTIRRGDGYRDHARDRTGQRPRIRLGGNPRTTASMTTELDIS